MSANFTPVAQLHRQVIMRIGGEKYRAFILLYQAWRGIVGDLFASRSRPFRFRQSILYIGVQNNTWMQELVLRKADILIRCRKVVPDEIKDIIFQIRS